jgi:predicted nucleotidyltransferase
MQEVRLKQGELTQRLAESLKPRQDIVFAYLFGSAAESDVFEDVDVGIYLKGTVRDGFGYSVALSGELERVLGYRVDVILMNTALDQIIYHITRGVLLVNNDDDLRADVVTLAWKRYWDFAFVRDNYLRDVAEGASQP